MPQDTPNLDELLTGRRGRRREIQAPGGLVPVQPVANPIPAFARPRVPQLRGPGLESPFEDLGKLANIYGKNVVQPKLEREQEEEIQRGRNWALENEDLANQIQEEIDKKINKGTTEEEKYTILRDELQKLVDSGQIPETASPLWQLGFVESQGRLIARRAGDRLEERMAELARIEDDEGYPIQPPNWEDVVGQAFSRTDADAFVLSSVYAQSAYVAEKEKIVQSAKARVNQARSAAASAAYRKDFANEIGSLFEYFRNVPDEEFWDDHQIYINQQIKRLGYDKNIQGTEDIVLKLISDTANNMARVNEGEADDFVEYMRDHLVLNGEYIQDGSPADLFLSTLAKEVGDAQVEQEVAKIRKRGALEEDFVKTFSGRANNKLRKLMSAGVLITDKVLDEVYEDTIDEEALRALRVFDDGDGVPGELEYAIYKSMRNATEAAHQAPTRTSEHLVGEYRQKKNHQTTEEMALWLENHQSEIDPITFAAWDDEIQRADRFQNSQPFQAARRNLMSVQAPTWMSQRELDDYNDFLASTLQELSGKVQEGIADIPVNLIPDKIDSLFQTKEFVELERSAKKYIAEREDEKAKWDMEITKNLQSANFDAARALAKAIPNWDENYVKVKIKEIHDYEAALESTFSAVMARQDGKDFLVHLEEALQKEDLFEGFADQPMRQQEEIAKWRDKGRALLKKHYIRLARESGFNVSAPSTEEAILAEAISAAEDEAFKLIGLGKPSTSGDVITPEKSKELVVQQDATNQLFDFNIAPLGSRDRMPVLGRLFGIQGIRHELSQRTIDAFKDFGKPRRERSTVEQFFFGERDILSRDGRAITVIENPLSHTLMREIAGDRYFESASTRDARAIQDFHTDVLFSENPGQTYMAGLAMLGIPLDIAQNGGSITLKQTYSPKTVHKLAFADYAAPDWYWLTGPVGNVDRGTMGSFLQRFSKNGETFSAAEFEKFKEFFYGSTPHQFGEPTPNFPLAVDRGVNLYLENGQVVVERSFDIDDKVKIPQGMVKYLDAEGKVLPPGYFEDQPTDFWGPFLNRLGYNTDTPEAITYAKGVWLENYKKTSVANL